MKKLLSVFKENKLFAVFTILVIALLVIAVLAPYITPQDPLAQTLRDAYQAPSAAHWLGTDMYGRDIFSRILYGTRVTLTSALAIVVVSLVIGVLLGMIAGYAGGIIDAVIMRICDIMISFPGLILAMAIAGILGASFGNAILSLVAVSWTKYARLPRSLVLKIKHRDYISAARVTGSSDAHILGAYMFPNTIPTMIVTAANDIGTTMMGLSGLSFLGVGITPPTPEGGAMLSEGRQFIQQYPWMIIFPGIAILICVVVFNLWSDQLRDVLDPTQAQQ